MSRWVKRIDLSDIWPQETPVTGQMFVELRDEIVKRIRESGWNTVSEYLIDDLASATDADDFDATWCVIYDQADADRVWINLWTKN